MSKIQYHYVYDNSDNIVRDNNDNVVILSLVRVEIGGGKKAPIKVPTLKRKEITLEFNVLGTKIIPTITILRIIGTRGITRIERILDFNLVGKKSNRIDKFYNINSVKVNPLSREYNFRGNKDFISLLDVLMADNEDIKEEDVLV